MALNDNIKQLKIKIDESGATTNNILVKYASQLKNAVNINGVPFDGSSNITIPSGSSIKVSENPPSNPNVGDLWWDNTTVDGGLFLYYFDGNSSQWVQVNVVAAEETALIDVNNVNTDIIPIANNTYNLGSIDNRWKDLYISGTVNGVTAAMVGLGNVTNESKSTMFANPTFTGTVNGVTAAMVGLGNVINESKSTMFANPTFTGTVNGVTAAMVGAATTTEYISVIPTTGYSGSSAPYSISIPLVGILDTDNPIVDIDLSGDPSWLLTQSILENWTKVFDISTSNGLILVKVSDIPLVSIPIKIKVVR
jgi:hypothetical protein